MHQQQDIVTNYLYKYWHYKTKAPTNREAKGTVKLSSRSELMGSDSIKAAAKEIIKKPITIHQLCSINPNKWK